MIQILLKLFMFANAVKNIEHHKTEMLAAGIWKATKGTANQKEIGYYLNSLYSPVGWMSWETCYRNFKTGNNITIFASKYVRFKARKALKEAVK